MARSLKQLLIGNPLETASLHEQRLPKKSALAVLASDNLSSTAYATEEILLALTAGAVFIPLFYSIPLGLAIALLTLIVVISYGQTLYAYPTGGGAYTVAKENLGVMPGLLAGCSLLIDYSLTVAVSVTAGIAALTSAFPALYEYRVYLCLLGVLLILTANLRGVRESAALFVAPVYLFIGSAYLLVAGGLFKYFRSQTEVAAVVTAAPADTQSALWNFALVFLLLRAFASGCAALTGIEAVATGVKVFKEPVSRNAALTLYILAVMLGTLFLGITVNAYLYQVTPIPTKTVLAQLGESVFGRGPVYFTIQGATMLILILAANTSFTGFPRLASVMAQDRFLPRQLSNLGDRLVFSNGILLLGLVAALLIVLFEANVHALIPLYMVGVFTAFTLSQAGMVVHWRRTNAPGRGWRAGVNAFGAFTTALVLAVVAAVKFLDGAWLILLAIPTLVFACWRVRRHYFVVRQELSLAKYEKPTELRHTAVVPVAGMNKMVLGAIEYAKSISQDVVAVTINVGDEQTREEMMERWSSWAPDVPLVVLDSPYRSIHRPLLRFIDELEDWRDDDVITVVIPEFVTRRWWHQALHNQTSLFLKAALLFKPKVIVTSVPHHLAK